MIGGGGTAIACWSQNTKLPELNFHAVLGGSRSEPELRDPYRGLQGRADAPRGVVLQRERMEELTANVVRQREQMETLNDGLNWPMRIVAFATVVGALRGVVRRVRP